MKANLDDIAAKLPPSVTMKVVVPKFYYQKLQSLRGGRKFTLRTERVIDYQIKIALFEDMEDTSKFIGSRTSKLGDEDHIKKCIKSLERKAGCKLYYVLLISTDGDYL